MKNIKFEQIEKRLFRKQVLTVQKKEKKWNWNIH